MRSTSGANAPSLTVPERRPEGLLRAKSTAVLLPRNAVQGLLRAYKRWLSPMLPVSCRYVPTCSEYAGEAIERYGVLRGTLMATWRVLRCNPFGGSGYDPVLKTKVADETRVCAHMLPVLGSHSKVEVRNS
jgi:uncharacterized protein